MTMLPDCEYMWVWFAGCSGWFGRDPVVQAVLQGGRWVGGEEGGPGRGFVVRPEVCFCSWEGSLGGPRAPSSEAIDLFLSCFSLSLSRSQTSRIKAKTYLFDLRLSR